MLGQKRTAESAFVADKWPVVQNAVNSVLIGRRAKVSFQYVYQCIFQLCQAKHGQELALMLEDLFGAHVESVIATIDAAHDDVFLETVSEQLRRYRCSLEKINSLLLFYNHNFALSAHRPTAQQLGESLLGSLLFTREQFNQRLLAQFHMKLHDDAHWDSVSAYSHELVLLEAGKWVQVGFENPFLDALIGRYTALSRQLRPQKSVGGYIEWVHLVVEGESVRVQNLLNAAFADRVQATLENVLITQEHEFILNGSGGVVERLDAWDVAGLRTSMDALASVGQEDLVTDEVLRAVSKTVHSIFGAASRSSAVSVTVERIVRLLNDTSTIASTMRSSGNRSRVSRTVDDAVNSCAELPDMLSAYIDHGMSASADEARDCIVDRAIVLFRALRDKDVFESAYRSRLAARLMHANPHIICVEKNFISKLKEEASGANVTRLEGMLADVETSATVNKRIANEVNTGVVALPIEFQIAVLTTAFWPTIPSTVMRLPQSMAACQSFFTDHYLRRHNGRKLVFNLNTGSVDFSLRTAHGEYAVFAPTLYVHTVLALNSDKDIRVESLAELSSLTQGELTMQLGVLEQMGLVVRSTDGAFRFNTQFVPQRSRIRISAATAPKAVSSAAGHTTRRDAGVQGARISSLDAVIVKCLKKEKTLHHDVLCAHVVSGLKHIFTPTVADIKGRLGILMDRGFITRSSTDGYYVYCE